MFTGLQRLFPAEKNQPINFYENISNCPFKDCNKISNKVKSGKKYFHNDA